MSLPTPTFEPVTPVSSPEKMVFIPPQSPTETEVMEIPTAPPLARMALPSPAPTEVLTPRLELQLSREEPTHQRSLFFEIFEQLRQHNCPTTVEHLQEIQMLKSELRTLEDALKTEKDEHQVTKGLLRRVEDDYARDLLKCQCKELTDENRKLKAKLEERGSSSKATNLAIKKIRSLKNRLDEYD